MCAKNARFPIPKDFDIYIHSGGPAAFGYKGTNGKEYFNLIDKLEDHNLSIIRKKKHAFFLCHSFS